DHRCEGIDAVVELRAAGYADVTVPRHRDVFLGGALRVIVDLRRLGEAGPRGRVIAAPLLLRRDALELRDVAVSFARLRDNLQHLVGAEAERNERRYRSD